ncbi:putative elmo ced-12 family protein [Zalerion maritima]|uniref:Elmo ced-12 family protein n=1 Tax=Zalerion maritima TaxID=339359 RepID=A0AAD5RI68_9PEZI|nr:putative elmo ced-12 family protein [Zalerion maritima]
MDQADIPALLARLASDEDAARKMAVFKLQSSINDPAFADVFISSGGLVILRRLIMTTGGNTLAYSLQSLSRLLEVDMGWDIFEGIAATDLVERVVELVVTNPLVNILRGAMSILVAIVSHSQSSSGAAGLSNRAESSRAAGGSSIRAPGSFGFRALRPAVAVYPTFYELVIAQLQSADHALCANALALINALIRDILSTDLSAVPTTPGGSVRTASSGDDWPKFIKKLQDLGLIKAVYHLMQSSALQDLAHPLLEFQGLTKVLLRRWREVSVDLERPEHRRALKGLHLASAPDRQPHTNGTTNGIKKEEPTAESARKGSRKHNPEKWRRLGFETESPTVEFEHMGFLGMMDMTDYVRKNEDGFQKLLLEQSTQSMPKRCPVAKSSLAVTMILYDHFEVDKPDEDVKTYQQLDGTKSSDKVFRPLLLQWSRLHTAGLQAFFRIWKATGAEQDDFDKAGELVRILIDQVVGQAVRTKDVVDVEEELHEFDCARLRELQMELLELAFEDQWGTHLYQVREELKREALQFVKEQRIRCLLQGSWFTKPVPKRDRADSAGKCRLYQPRPWRFAKLSHNRRFLHYADFVQQTPQDPGLDAMVDRVDLSTISSVVSNVSAPKKGEDLDEDDQSVSSNGTRLQNQTPKTTTKITIYSYASAEEAAKASSGAQDAREQAILTLYPQSHSLASEWLDGLLMLLNQAPITAETSRLVGQVYDFGLKIRLLNVRFESVYSGTPAGAGVVPSREGLDDDYYYQV